MKERLFCDLKNPVESSWLGSGYLWLDSVNSEIPFHRGAWDNFIPRLPAEFWDDLKRSKGFQPCATRARLLQIVKQPSSDSPRGASNFFLDPR